MDEKDLRKAGEAFKVGEDLYGVSVTQLSERLEILQAEIARINRELTKKGAELSAAENFFKKS